MDKYNEIVEAYRNGELDLEEYLALLEQCKKEREEKPLPTRIDEEFTFSFVGDERVKVVLSPFENGDIVTCKVFTRTGNNNEWKLAELSATSFIEEDYWQRVKDFALGKIYQYCLTV